MWSSSVTKRSVGDEDGLIGADVFGGYLIDIDLPGMRLKLSPLPKRPEDTVAPTSLNSEGEEQANAEQKEGSVTEQTSKEQKSSAPISKPAQHLPRDRYIAPEMANWTKVFRFGHSMLGADQRERFETNAVRTRHGCLLQYSLAARWTAGRQGKFRGPRAGPRSERRGE